MSGHFSSRHITQCWDLHRRITVKESETFNILVLIDSLCTREVPVQADKVVQQMLLSHMISILFLANQHLQWEQDHFQAQVIISGGLRATPDTRCFMQSSISHFYEWEHVIPLIAFLFNSTYRIWWDKIHKFLHYCKCSWHKCLRWVNSTDWR